MRVAIYTRVSTEKQARVGDSLREQEDSLIKYAQENNWQIVDIYRDEGISGQKINRDEFQRLMVDVQDNKVDVIIFTFLVRWFRDPLHYLTTQEILNKHKVKWIAIREPYLDNSTPFMRKQVVEMMSQGKFEAEVAGERISAVLDYKISIGEVASGAVPLGYSIKDKRMIINEDAEKVVKIFNHFIRVGSIRNTMLFMYNELGIERTYNNVKKIITNKKYIGEHRGNINFCPAIIDQETFYTAQSLLKKNVKNNTKRTFVFSSIIRCNECGNKYIGTTSRVKYYRKSDDSIVEVIQKIHRCGTHQMNIRRCGNKKVYTEKKIEKYLLSNVQDKLHEYISEQKQKKQPENVKDNKTKIKQLETKLDRLKKGYVDGVFELDEYKKDREDILKQIEKLEVKPKPNFIKSETFKEVLSKEFHDTYNNANEEEKRLIWRSIIDYLIVDHEGNIKIIFLS